MQEQGIRSGTTLELTRKLQNRSVAIIGAGAAGLCAGRQFMKAGFDIQIYEVGSKIGGMWCYENDSGLSPAYRTLHINTSRNVTRFRELDFDDDVQFFPDHADMYRYLQKYAEKFDLIPHIRFNARVLDVSPVENDSRPASVSEPESASESASVSDSSTPNWLVTSADGLVQSYDTVIVASGHLSIPSHVDMFRNDFKGQYLHSSEYREPAEYAGKRICIVGVGNSACDISGDLCASSRRCVLVARTGVIIIPKLLFGIPFTEITSRLQQAWIPYAVRRRLILFLTWIAHGRIDRLGFKKPETRVHTTSNGTIVTDVAYRRIEIKHGIDSIHGQTIRFSDGTEEEFDVLIAATGYKIDLPFISSEMLSFDRNNLELYQRIVAPNLASMYFVGFFNTDTALMKIFEEQLRWILEVETGRAKLPDKEAMEQAIKDRTSWVRANYKDSERHRLEEESVPYIRALHRSMKLLKRA